MDILVSQIQLVLNQIHYRHSNILPFPHILYSSSPNFSGLTKNKLSSSPVCSHFILSLPYGSTQYILL